MADDERKIIIDEDWKAQVERERAQAASRETPEVQAEAAPDDAGDELTLFEDLVSTLAMQTTMALGLVAQQNQEQVFVDLGLAKHLIDTLIMLREKTEGNLSERELSGLREAISELQRVFAIRAQQARDAAMKEAGLDPKQPPQP